MKKKSPAFGDPDPNNRGCPPSILNSENPSSVENMQGTTLHTSYHWGLSEDAQIFQFCVRRQNLGISTHHIAFDILLESHDEYIEILKEYLNKKNYTTVSHETTFLATSVSVYLSVTKLYMGDNLGGARQTKAAVKIAGDYEEIEKIKKEILSKYKSAENQIYIDWKFLTTDGIRTLNCPLDLERVPFQEMYPFLSYSLNEYYAKFVESKSNILILKGPPGTGKTTFIKGLLHFSKSNAVFVQDEGLLSKDALFVDFFESSTKFLICEDADAFLTPRCKGNQFVHKFLNVAEGLISNKDKKIILTTNLSSINDMDQALVRPGRCFDILEFPELNRKEAEILAKKFELDLDFSDKNFTMAEVLNCKKNNKVKSIGFF